MTATEELCRMLDERGVKWWEASPCKIKWISPVLGGPVSVSEWNGKMVLDAGYVNVTPAQAVEATLGDADMRSFCDRLREAAEAGEAVELWGHEYYPSCGREVAE